MYLSNSNGEGCDDAGGDSLSAGLIEIATINPGGNRCRRLLRYIGVVVLISTKKLTPNYHHEIQEEEEEARSTSASYVPLPTDPPAPATAPASGEPHVVVDVIENISESQQLLKRIIGIVKDRDLISLRKLGGVDSVAESLLPKESHFQEEQSNLHQDGHDRQAWISNSNTIYKSKGFLYFLLQAFNSYTIFLLFGSACLAFAIDIMDQGAKYGWHDGVAILIAISMLLVFPSVSNFYRERKTLKMHFKDSNKLVVEVVRNGRRQQLAISDVVVGDRVYLKKGDNVPADGLFLDGENLVLDEILNSKIDCVRNPFLFAGSKVMDGHGSMIVTSIGANTAWGCEVLKLVTAHGSNEKKLFQSLIDKSYAYMDTLALCISLLIALVVLIRLLFFSKDHESDYGLPELKGEVSMKFVMQVFERMLLKPKGKVSILASMLVFIVIGIQHGMPIVITISLCCWKEKLELSQVDPRNLSACGSMGLVTIIFLDASGICDEMEVKEFWVGEKDIISNELDNETDAEVLDALHRGIGLPVLLPEVSVCPINDTLISWMERRWNLNMEILEKNFSIFFDERLSSSNRVNGVLMRKTGDEEHILHLHCKGAASTILEKCSHFYDTKGKKHSMKSQKGLFEKVIKDMENSGLRPFAFACRQIDTAELKEDGLNLLAIVGLKYQCRNEIKSGVEAFRKAGVMAKLVSDDELPAVRAIAWELGFFDRVSNNLAIEGQEIRQMMESSRIERVDETAVMGNCLPKDKFLMVEDSKKKGHVVAFYGGLTTRDTLA